MKYIMLGLLALVTVACSSEQVVTNTRYIVVMPAESMFECELTRLPESSRLTDAQIARLLVEMHQNTARCRNNIRAIRTFLEETKQRLERS